MNSILITLTVDTTKKAPIVNLGLTVYKDRLNEGANIEATRACNAQILTAVPRTLVEKASAVYVYVVIFIHIPKIIHPQRQTTSMYRI